jgi:hypothetical protein
LDTLAERLFHASIATNPPITTTTDTVIRP